MKRGDVIVIPFPFREATGGKVRPAIVLAETGTGEALVCMVTSREPSDGTFSGVRIGAEDFQRGGLPRESFARPSRLFTADVSRVSGVVGTLKPETLAAVVDGVVSLLRGDTPTPSPSA
jgi:mRNA interferase MazF